MVTPRFHVTHALQPGELVLPSAVARHVRVLRLDAGDGIVLFDGGGGEWHADVTAVGRQDVRVDVKSHHDVERELTIDVHLAVGAPTNDRMDTLVEKATELGAASIRPLLTERSVLRLSGERAAKKVAHWQAVAVAACEQCGRNRVPVIHPMAPIAAWLGALQPATAVEHRWLLSTATVSPLDLALARGRGVVESAPSATPPTRFSVHVLSGPEGGLTDVELALAARRGFEATSLGPRILRADTAPLAMLVLLGAAATIGL